MRYKITLALIIITSILWFQAPPATAFWPFSRTKTETVTEQKPINRPTDELNDFAKDRATAKYKIWADSFEKANLNLVIANQEKFSFTTAEINYIFASETKKAKNPILTNFRLTSSQENLNIAGDFHKIVSGRFSFIARVISVDKKAHLALSAVKLYGIPIPNKWLADPLNRALDEYFSFLYRDSRYQGFSFLNKDNVLQFKPEFKK
ncbi:MAG: hypothetical protein WC863_02355 [Patescibacteria group bacterium]